MELPIRLTTGTRLRERYQIERALGAGAAGAVYLAADLNNPGLRIALKLIGGHSDPLIRDSLVLEFKLLAGLRHPNLAEVLEIGDAPEAGAVYLAQSYCPGTPIDQLGYGADDPRWVPIFAQLVNTLEFLAFRGLFHGDLKAEHVLVLENGLVKLLDFGLSASRLGGDKVSGGTPRFLPPEALSGAATAADRDLYALGVLLWDLFADAPIFQGAIDALLAEKQRPPQAPEGRRWLVAASALIAADGNQRLVSFQRLREQLALPRGENYLPYVRTSQLVEREDALRTVKRGLRSGAVLLRGRGGFGKTRLVETIIDEAMLSGHSTVRIRPHGGSQIPFAPFRGLLSRLQHVESLDETQRAAATLATGGSESHSLARSGTFSQQEGRQRLVVLLSEAIVRSHLRPEPAVLAIEDLDRFDALSLALTLALARRCRQDGGRSMRLLISGDYHPTAWDLLLNELALPSVELAPLSAAGCERFIADALGVSVVPPSVVETVRQLSDGQPLSIEETLAGLLRNEQVRAWDSPARREHSLAALVAAEIAVPRTEEAALNAALAGLDDGELAALDLLALTGEPLPAETVRRLSGCADWSRLNARGLVQPHLDSSGMLVATGAPRVSHYLRPRISAERGRRVITPYLVLLDDPPAGLSVPAPEWLVEICERVGDQQRLRRYLLLAARVAAGRFDDLAAAQFYRRYEACGGQLARVFAQWVSALVRSGRTDELTELVARRGELLELPLAAAFERLAPLAVVPDCFDYLRAGCELDYLSGQLERCATRALRLSEYDLGGESALLALAVRALNDLGRFSEAKRHVVTRLADRLEPGLMLLLGTIEFNLGHLEQAEENYRQAAQAFADNGDAYQQCRSLYNLATLHYQRAEHALAQHFLSDARALADTHSLLRYQVLTRNLSGSLSMVHDGDYAAALEGFEFALSLALQLGDPKLLAELANSLAKLYRLLGQFDRGEAVLRRGLRHCRTLKSLYMETALRCTYGELELQRERLGAAERQLEKAERLVAATGERITGAVVAVVRLALWNKQRKYQAVFEKAEPLLAELADLGFDDLEVEILLALGTAQLESNAWADAQRTLERARGYREQFGAYEYGWRIPYLYALACRGLGRHDEARDSFAEAKQVLGAIAEGLPEQLAAAYLYFVPERRTAWEALREISSSELREPQGMAAGDKLALTRLLEVTSALNAESDLKSLLGLILDSAIALTTAERGILLLKEEGQLVAQVARGLDATALDPGTEQLSHSVAEEAARTGNPVFTVDAMDDARFDTARSVHLLKLRSIIAFPLKVKGSVVGAIYLDNQTRAGVFTERDLPFLLAFGSQAAVAIENASLLTRLKRAEQQLRRDNRYLQQEIDRQYDVEGIIGSSRQLGEVLRVVKKVAQVPSAVLIRGESGTGKELIARAIHNLSDRRERPLIKVNCAALAETLLESELFGHERGAFTGADRRRIGHFELADGGTIFLDEIGDISATTQVKLLRVLQEREITRVGGGQPITLDVRVITATNRNLEQMIERGQFRQDLYYRLNVFPIFIPPLRDRREDIPVLLKTFVSSINRKLGRDVNRVEPRALEKLERYDWPGNVRELEHVVERAVILCEGDEITMQDLPPEVAGLVPALSLGRSGGSGGVGPLKELVDDFKAQLIKNALAQSQGNRTEAAKRLSLQRRHLYILMDKLGIG